MHFEELANWMRLAACTITKQNRTYQLSDPGEVFFLVLLSFEEELVRGLKLDFWQAIQIFESLQAFQHFHLRSASSVPMAIHAQEGLASFAFLERGRIALNISCLSFVNTLKLLVDLLNSSTVQCALYVSAGGKCARTWLPSIPSQMKVL